MPNFFLELPANDQAELLKIHALQVGITPIVAEKDIWLCWVLQQLFSMPDRLPMAFKGGTSLSKIYNVIERFSEDVDITLDYRGFMSEISGEISRSALKKLSDELKGFVANYSKNFQNLLADQFGKEFAKVDVSDDGEKVRIHYPSVLKEERRNYLAASILIEFGGRNITEPNEQHLVRPYLATSLTDMHFPEANTTVLSLQRTFREKATLIHVECNRHELKANADRLSRHWYDMACLASDYKGQQAILDRKLLADVIKYKKLFYNSSFANYDACLNSALKLVPNAHLRDTLEQDFKQMLDSNMFYGKQMTFSKIIETVQLLEQSINSQTGKY